VKILTFTSLFPNNTNPQLGVFISQRVLHLSKQSTNQLWVVAPVPFFPRWLRWGKWQSSARVAAQEQLHSLSVSHPRYFLLPRISMPFHALLMFLGSFWRVRTLQKELQFDCLDAHFVYPDGTAAVMLGKVLGLPVVVSARGTDMNLFPNFRLIRPMIRWTLEKASGVIAVSTSLKQVMLKMGLSAERVQVIGNGIDASRFSPVDPGEARQRLNIPQGGPVVVSVGSLIPRKGFQYLIPAFAEIAPKFPGARLYIIGEGNYRLELQQLAERLSVQEQVFLTGNRPNEELKFWFSGANVSCLVSSREGWPNVLQESLACGTPVVATNVWGAPEVITSPDLGLLVEQNTAAIAAGLQSALDRPWDRTAIAAHAQQRTWEVVAAEVDSYLRSVTANKSTVYGKGASSTKASR
jgi:teichuronic acid biosynthesis glycosyltransferase TuaC